MKSSTCYMCNQKATTREHIPPISIFPEQKDVNGIDFRKNLITVPSCDLHNLKKSKDDEFLMACLAGIVGNNEVGFVQTKTKVSRAVKRREKLANFIIKDPINFQIKSENGIIFPLQYGSIDNKRLIKCFEHIAYGLYYHEFNKVFDGECGIIPSFLNYKDEEIEKVQEILKKQEEYQAKNWECKGENPEVFYYQIAPRDYLGFIILILTFYETAKVYVSFRESDIEKPFDLIEELIKAGHKVNYEFPDKTKIEIQKKK